MVKVVPLGQNNYFIFGPLAGFGNAKFGKMPFGVPYSDGNAVDYIKSGVSMAGINQIKQIGQSCGFGSIRFGKTLFGDDRFFSGIYQKRNTGYNNRGYIPGRPKKNYYVKMRTYRPTNPQTPAQQARRALFAEIVAEWPLLTKSEKLLYSKRGLTLGRPGRNQFISEQMKIRLKLI